MYLGVFLDPSWAHGQPILQGFDNKSLLESSPATVRSSESKTNRFSPIICIDWFKGSDSYRKFCKLRFFDFEKWLLPLPPPNPRWQELHPPSYKEKIDLPNGYRVLYQQNNYSLGNFQFHLLSGPKSSDVVGRNLHTVWTFGWYLAPFSCPPINN